MQDQPAEVLTHPEAKHASTPTTADVARQYEQYVFPQVKNLHTEPMVVTDGRGGRVRDLENQTYLDFFGGILTVSLGHANEEVNRAVIAQVHRLSHISTLYPTLPMGELAERLARITPGALQKCFFTASGSEADEAAIMMAQSYTGNTEIIALRHGYSGRTQLAQGLTGNAAWRGSGDRASVVRHALAPYCYRCPLKLTYPKCGVACAHDVEELIRTATSGQVAGMLIEPIQGVGGFITPPKEYFAIVAEIVRRYGGVFIADEVQTGFGRTGHMWGIEHHDVEPEMMTMGQGHRQRPAPRGAGRNGTGRGFAPQVHHLHLRRQPGKLRGGQHGDRYRRAGRPGGNHAGRQGERLRDGLLRIQRRFPACIGDVRGRGLMQALELVADETVGDRTPAPELTQALLDAARARGLLVGRGGTYNNVIRISPPLNVSGSEVDEALSILERAMASVA